MKFSTLTATAALCAALGMTAPVLALELSAGASVDASASASSDGGSGSSGASVGAGANVGASSGDGDDNGDDNGNDNGDDSGSGASAQAGADGSVSASANSNVDHSATADLAFKLAALIKSSTWHEGSLKAVTDVSTAATFDIDEVIDAESRVAVKAAIDANISNIENLRTAIKANATLNAWLQSQNTDADSVVAIGATGDGSLAVFTD